MKIALVLLTTLFILNGNAEISPAWILPDGIPNLTNTNGGLNDIFVTTPAYQKAALDRVIDEANLVAKQLDLPEDLPITKNNLIGAFISPFGFAYTDQKIGNVTTSNYCYCVSIGNKFSYVNEVGWEDECKDYQKEYVWPIEKMDTNAAYELATQWLMAVHMDVKALNRDLPLIIKMDNEVVWATPGKFVPVYYVAWCKKSTRPKWLIVSNPKEWEAVASVRLFAPTKTLLELRVEDSKYILRSPIIFTNLGELLKQTNSLATTNAPASP
jgi:hypothetical protein